MNPSALARDYALLTPEERFRLVLAAHGRGDGAERDRLAAAAPRITLSMRHDAPFLRAFWQLSVLTFLELSELAAWYVASLAGGDDLRRLLDAVLADREAGRPGAVAAERRAAGAASAPGGGDARRRRQPEAARAFAFLLTTRADGWKLFCERLGVPPFALLSGLPSFGRLRCVLPHAADAAFDAGQMLRRLNRTRRAGEPELSALPTSVESLADEADRWFRATVAKEGG